MHEALSIQLNGAVKTLDGVAAPATVASFVEALQFRADRVALELNGAIVSRSNWADTLIQSGDRVELVHFVGGGSAVPQVFQQL